MSEPETAPVYPILRWSIPIHALLPVLIGLTVELAGRHSDTLLGWLWLLIHVGFPIVLVLTYPRWQGRGEEVVAILVINHIVTFVVGTALIVWWPL